jgi:hypothetical protein
MMALSYRVPGIVLPKLGVSHAPQLSPPVARLSCAAPFVRSQSGTKFPLSFQTRAVVVTTVAAGLLAAA